MTLWAGASHEGDPPSGDDRPSAAASKLPIPRRPMLVELAAALLIVTGGIQLAAIVGLVVTGNLPPASEGVLVLSVVLDAGTIVAGLLLRAGRAWLLVINYVARLGFLHVLRATASPVALLIALVDLFALYVLFTQRSWFNRPVPEVEPAEE